MTDLAKPGEIVSFQNAHTNPYVRLCVKYDYENGDRCRCPACGGLGTPWHGWFSCEDCAAIAWIKTGEVFSPKGGPRA